MTPVKKELSYEQIVIIVAVFVFILTMLLFWFLTPTESKVYPPVMSNCPTGWSVNRTGTCNIPPEGGLNLGNLYGVPIYTVTDSNGKPTFTTDASSGGVILTDIYGNNILAYTADDIPAGYDTTKPQLAVVNFESPKWSDYGSTLCANRDWAIKHNIEWEGVTNFNQC
jgi:hypothetical protein